MLPASGERWRDRDSLRFVLFPLCVLLIEVICFVNLQPFLNHLLPGDPAGFVASPERGAALLHVLIKGLAAGALIWMLLFGTELRRARSRFALGALPNVFPWVPFVVHVLALNVMIFCRAKLNGYGIRFFDVHDGLLIALYGGAFGAFAFSTLRLCAPPAFWRGYLWAHRLRLVALTAVCLALVAISAVGVRPTDVEASYSSLFFAPTAAAASVILQWWGYPVLIDLVTHRIAVDGFIVEVASGCLGYEGMTIAFGVLCTYLYIHSESFRFPHALLVFPSILAALFLTNCLRLAALMAIGASWSADIALNGFHTAAGSINLLLILILAVLVLNRLPFFSKSPASFVFDLSAGRMQLVPQVALLGVALLSILASPGFEWLYPLRVVTIGALLLVIWPQLALGRISRLALPVAGGFAVFVVWLALVPEDPAKSAIFADALFSAPSWLANSWLVFRVVGAVVVVPLAEELAFRGYLFTQVQEKLSGSVSSAGAGAVIALVLTSAGFGLLHSSWLAGTVAGLGYGLLRMHGNRVMDAVIAHSVTNLLLAAYVVQFHAWSYW
jgi:exosortase E/protease (VPEID-CTERM system)